MQQQKQISIPVWMSSLLMGGCMGVLWAFSWAPGALAQSASLTRAEVYRLQNTVELLLRNQSPRQAQLQDIMAPRDAMRTGNRSRAELLFNEGSLAWLGSNSVFRFLPGLRRYQLPDGSMRSEAVIQLRSGVLAMAIPPAAAGGDNVDTTIETPEGSFQIISDPNVLVDDSGGLPDDSIALFVTSDPTNGQVQLIALTNTLVQFSGDPTPVLLQGGQTVIIMDGQLGQVQNFDLRQFYQTSQLAAGLGPDPGDVLAQSPEPVQLTLQEVRLDTLAAIARQDARQAAAQGNDPEGLCTLNARGGDTTLSANCIGSGADDPLSDFEDQREDGFIPD
ncbi:MAG: hypothetical protein AAF528_13880, partial [Cyanobacteria bacterium P01_C01_bin.121]